MVGVGALTDLSNAKSERGAGPITRFAPSPTGPLHLGHAYSALFAAKLAWANGGRFLIRMEDIDQSRARVAWEDAIYDDLTWLGLSWERPVLRQSDNMAAYHVALQQLDALGLIYACTCQRRDIMAAASAPQEGAPMLGPDGVIYPGTCRGLHHPHKHAALRLDMNAAFDHLGLGQIDYTELGVMADQPTQITLSRADMIATIGDVVLARRDMGTSYHLSVVVDDAAAGITHVTRGADLAEATPIHVLLQRLLGLTTPLYAHHALIRDGAGKRLAKRDDARALSTYRDQGFGAKDVMALITAQHPLP